MSCLICNNCEWYKDVQCSNPSSENYNIIIGWDNTCREFTPALTLKTKNGLILRDRETVNHPNHYNVGEIEAIDFIESWDLNFSLGNAIKYIARAPYKNDEIEDLKKARWYIDREIQRLEKDTK